MYKNNLSKLISILFHYLSCYFNITKQPSYCLKYNCCLKLQFTLFISIVTNNNVQIKEGTKLNQEIYKNTNFDISNFGNKRKAIDYRE